MFFSLFLGVCTCVVWFIEPGENSEDAARGEVQGILDSYCCFSFFSYILLLILNNI